MSLDSARIPQEIRQSWRGGDWAAFLFIFGISALLIFAGLGKTGFWSPSEGLIIEIAREMLETRDFIQPRINGNFWITKPPLAHWITAWCFSNFGFTELVARTPFAIGALATVVAVFLAGRVFFGRMAGLFAALILLTTPDFLWISRETRLDGPLTLFIVLTSCLFLLALENPRRMILFAILAGIFMGLGVLIKGPVAAILPALALIGATGLRGFRRRGGLKLVLISGFFCLIVAAPWFVVTALNAPAKNREWFFWGQIQKWLTSEGGAKGWLVNLPAYVPYFLKGFFPWSLFVPFGLVMAFKGLKTAESRSVEKDALRMLLYWFVIGLALFSFSATKAGRYLLPFYPTAAMIIGYGFAKLSGSPDQAVPLRWLKMGAILLFAIAMTLVVFAVGFEVAPDKCSSWLHARFIDSDPVNGWAILAVMFRDWWIYLAVFSTVFAAATIGALYFLRRRCARLAFSCLALSAILQVAFWCNFLAPKLDRHFSPKAFAERARDVCGSSGKLYWWGRSCRPLHFYLRRNFTVWKGAHGAPANLDKAMAEGDWAVLFTDEGKALSPLDLAPFDVRVKGACQYGYLYLVAPGSKSASASRP